ncbi:septum site-determining protein MinC [Thermodesulfitimonas sp.]
MQGVQIKGTRNGLVIMLNPARTFDELKESLLHQLEQARDFFKGARVTFYNGQTEIPAEHRQELLRIVARYGLIYTDDITYPSAGRPVARRLTATPSNAICSKHQQVLSTIPPEPAALPGIGEPALLLNRSLRAGQTVKTERHLVVTGDVHPGAQVSAGGSIVVLGHLAGRATAGLYGDRTAVVVAGRFAPVTLSIAGISGTPPGRPLIAAKAVLEGDQIVYRSLYK